MLGSGAFISVSKIICNVDNISYTSTIQTNENTKMQSNSQWILPSRLFTCCNIKSLTNYQPFLPFQALDASIHVNKIEKCQTL